MEIYKSKIKIHLIEIYNYNILYIEKFNINFFYIILLFSYIVI
jgi:hypothetical protein